MIDWDDLAKIILATLFVVGMGVLAAFTWGYIAIVILFEVLFGY